MIKEPHADLPEDVLRILIRCEGYLDLKMPGKAEEELRGIPAAHADHPHVQWMHSHAMGLRGDWKTAQPLMRALREKQPDELSFWIQDAYITRRAEAIESARAILEEALDRFPDAAIVRYNLSCYACRLGRVEEARQRLKEAIDIDEKYLGMALRDDDLEELHDELEDWGC